MGPGISENAGATLQSPIHWAMLGLIIERPGHCYELAQRFDRAFGGTLTMSANYAYRAADVLQRHGLVEAIPGNAGRRLKLDYRATRAGIEAYRKQLISEAEEDRRRSRLFARKLAAFINEPETALGLIAQYRDACLKDAVRSPLAGSSPGSESSPADRLAARLEDEEARVRIDAKLAWLDYATKELEALIAKSSA